MRLVQEPAIRLLIDISARPAPPQGSDGNTLPDPKIPDFVYRTAFCVTEPQLIADLGEQVSPGDVIEARGSFWQTGYVPHKGGYIDTKFCLSGFRLIRKQAFSSARHNPFRDLLSYPNMH